MADRALGIHFFVMIVLLLSVKDMLFINKEDENSGSKPAVNNNQPINLDPNQEFTTAESSSDKFDNFDDFSKQETDSDNHSSHTEDRIIDDDEVASYDKKIPSLKMKNNVQTLKFSFCYSCGYRNAFQQYSEMIRARFPEIQIVGENYSPQAYKVYIAQFLSSFKLLVIALILFGQNPFTYLNMPTPAVFEWALQNKLYATLMTFFLSNAIETHLITTGAFEIYLNNIQIWSKLQSDRFPAEKELLQILDVNFNFESEKNTAFGAGAGSMKF